MSLPALPVTADTRSITERVNVLIRDYNTLLGVPAGCIMPYAGATAPDGWLLCHGQAVSRTTYADLFAAIGTAYGPGDGSTTFNVPDLRGRVAAGRDDMGGTDAGRLAGGVANRTTLGGAGGAATHTLGTRARCRRTAMASNDPSHSHQFLHGGSTPAAFTDRAGDGDGSNQLLAATNARGHRHLHPERRRRRRAQQHAADPHPQLCDRHMMPLRQPVRRSLGEGGGFGAQAPLPSALAARTVPPPRWPDLWPLLEPRGAAHAGQAGRAGAS